MKINVHMFIILFIAIMASVNDIIIFFLRLNYNISLAISAIFVTFVTIFLVKKFKIKIFNNFEKKDLLFLVPFMLVYSIIFLACDVKFDVYNYHIYNQQSWFNDKVNFDYLPNGSFFFPLGDRMAFIFRNILGYRLGTILSSYTLIVLFYQMKSILVELFPNITSKKKFIFSSIILLTVTPSLRSAGYHIDNFSMTFMLELIYIFIRQENIIKNKQVLYYLSLILGILTGIKIVNVIIGAIIILGILINSLKEIKFKIFKEIKIKDILICGILFCLPFFVYVLYNYLQTGNPVFPFLNNIFQSEYYKGVTGRDEKFGVPNFFSAFIWPIIITIKPEQGYDDLTVEPLWAIGYIVCVINILCKSEKKDLIWKLSLLGFILTSAWALCLNGYIRYALILPILFYIIIASNIIELYNNRKNKSICIENILVSVLTISLICTVYYGVNFINDKIRIAYDRRINFENYNATDEKYQIDGVWGSINFKSAMIDLIRNPDTPMYNLDITRDVNTYESSFSDSAQKELIEKIKDKKIYTVSPADIEYEVAKFLIKLDGYEIVGEPIKYKNSKYQNGNEIWYILELKYLGK